MEENVKENELGGNNEINRDEIYSKSIRSGKRTYFFDVKSTRQDELYLTITESKKRFSPDGSFQYEKHKIFLYPEDFGNFAGLLAEMIEYIDEHQIEKNEEASGSSGLNYADVKFDDLMSI
jgi:hypothetical protein